MMQWFHWYSEADGNHWARLEQEAPALAKSGITAVWLPPAYKGMDGAKDVGYATYDLFDLGEFDQKGSIRTKYGTKDAYLQAIRTCRSYGIEVYADAVFNHKIGGDIEESFEAIPLDDNNRHHALGQPRTVRSWTGFTFPGRGDTYSTMKWGWQHFDSVDYNSLDPGTKAVWQIKGKPLEDHVDGERGNYDFLMGCDLDLDHREVQQELKHWGEWTLDNTGVSGFRLDAIKHINSDFFVDWIEHIEAYAGRDVFIVGEFWSYDLGTLCNYASRTGGQMSLFDAPLHLNFFRASQSGGQFDMGSILEGTLSKEIPLLAVTLVDNHDTQPLQALESPVADWFKPLAYALILLRAEGYPCIFYPDYYGAEYSDYGTDGSLKTVQLTSHRYLIDRMLLARKHFAYGEQLDYFDDQNIIGWTRLGTELHPHGLAVVLSDGPSGSKWMRINQVGATYVDITNHCADPVVSNEHGWGCFPCRGGSVSVWVALDAIQASLRTRFTGS
ncbi:MAG: alpha-amylase [Cyanobacteria bacterium K_DeepCast_35m_m1_288]|nr:alpha-amylase [Cyanobacteria bacterium K_DeepCast_35m_m1_288]MBM5797797.1 alpha-amylase [Cyanobacteria bacterium K_Offshore_0m_m2_072]